MSRKALTIVFARMGWEILEMKYLYYNGKKCPHDSVYDQIEEKYNVLAQKLDLKPFASEMVGFDTSKPSCRMVAGQMEGIKGYKPKSFKYFQKVLKNLKKKRKKAR